MSSKNRADELKALEGVRSRMSKYTEALKKKNVSEKKEHVVVGTLDEQKKDVSNFISPTKNSKNKASMPLHIGSLSSSMLTTFEFKTKEERDIEELQAKDELGMLLDSTIPPNNLASNIDSDSNLSMDSSSTKLSNNVTEPEKSMTSTSQAVSTKGRNFKSIRLRYYQALDECKPQQGSKSLPNGKEACPVIKPYKAKRWARKAEAEKKDQFVKLRGAWDRYELAAQDRPKHDSAEEEDIREQIYKAEDEIVNKWVDYANQVVQEAMNKDSDETEGDSGDEEDDDDDLGYWIKEAKRMKAEADARRRAKEQALRRQAEVGTEDDEEEYWLQEAMTLRELNKNKKKNKKKSNDDTDNHDSGEGDEVDLINPYDDNPDVLAVAAAVRKAKEALHGNPFSGKSNLSSSSSKLTSSASDLGITSPIRNRIAAFSNAAGSGSSPTVSGVKGEKRQAFIKPNKSIQHVSADEEEIGLGYKEKKKNRLGKDDPDEDSSESEHARVVKQFEADEDNIKVPKKKSNSHQFADDSDDESSDEADESNVRKGSQRKKYQITDDDDTKLKTKKNLQITIGHDDESGEEADIKKSKKSFQENDAMKKEMKKKEVSNALSTDAVSSNEEGHALKSGQSNKIKDFKVGDDQKVLKKKSVAAIDDDDDDDLESEVVRKKKVFEAGYEEGEKKKKDKKSFGNLDDSSDDSGDNRDKSSIITNHRKKVYESDSEGIGNKNKNKINVGNISDDSSDNEGATTRKKLQKNINDVDSDDEDQKKKKKKPLESMDDDSPDESNSNTVNKKSVKKSYGSDSGNEKKKKKKGFEYDDDNSSDDESNVTGGATLIKKPTKKIYNTTGEDEKTRAKSKKSLGTVDNDSSEEEFDAADVSSAVKKPKKKIINSDSDTDDEKQKIKKSFQRTDDSSDDERNDDLSGDQDPNSVEKLKKKMYDPNLDKNDGKQKKKKSFGNMDDDSSQSDNDVSGKQKKNKKFSESESDSGDKKKRTKKNFATADDESSVESSNNEDPRSTAKPKKKAFDPDLNSDKKKTKTKSFQNIEDTSSDEDVDAQQNPSKTKNTKTFEGVSEAGDKKKNIKKKIRVVDDASSEDDNVAGGSNKVKKLKKKQHESESDSDEKKKISKKKLGKADKNDTDSSSSSGQEGQNVIQKGTITKKKSKKKLANAFDSDSDSGADRMPDKERKKLRQKKSSSHRELDEESKLKKKSLASNMDDSTSSSGDQEKPTGAAHKGRSSLYDDDSEYEYEPTKTSTEGGSMLTTTKARQNKMKLESNTLLSNSDTESDEYEEFDDKTKPSAKTPAGKKLSMPKKTNKKATSSKKKKNIEDSDTDSDDGKKKIKGKISRKADLNDSESDSQEERRAYVKGKSKASKPKRAGKAIAAVSDSEDDKKTGKVKRYSLGADESSESDDSNRNMMGGLSSYMGKTNTNAYDSHGDASMSDTVASDEESVKEQNRPSVAFRRASLHHLEDKQMALEEKSLHLDGSYWSYSLKDWKNKPKKKIAITETKIVMEIPSQSDFWRKTKHNFTKDNAPFHSEQWTGDFEVLVCVSGDFNASYQKGGIMIRFDDEHWIFTGMEYVDGKIFMSNIVSNNNSDRSIVPLPPNAQAAGVWFCIKRNAGSFESFYSFDTKKWILTRQTLMGDGQVAHVGITGASPADQKLVMTYNYFKCSKGDIFIGRHRGTL